MDLKMTIGIENVYQKKYVRKEVIGTSDRLPFQGLMHAPAVSE